MDIKEKKEIWDSFSYNMYCSRPFYKNLKGAEIIELENGHEIRIPVDDSFKEYQLNREFPEIRRKLGYQSYNALLPVQFAFIRKDGTIITEEEWAKHQEELRKKAAKLPPELFKMPSREEMFQSSVREDIRKSKEEVVSLANTGNDVAYVGQSKNEFQLILEEMQKADVAEPSLDNADCFLAKVKESLEIIEKKLGSDSDQFKHASNLIVNKYLDIVIKTVNNNPKVSILKQAGKRFSQLYSYAITETTKSRVLQTSVKCVELEQKKTHAWMGDYNSKGELRPSVKLERFANKIRYVESGGRRYTSPANALLALPIFGLAWIVSLFDKK